MATVYKTVENVEKVNDNKINSMETLEKEIEDETWLHLRYHQS